MATQGNNGISWTEETWSPVTGCSHVSPGCQNCYAERVAKRLHGMGQQAYTSLPWTAQNAAENVMCHQNRLGLPVRWTKPRRIFVCSMADLFHEQVPFTFIASVFNDMHSASWHVFQVLTKRPHRILEFFQWLRDVKAEDGWDSVGVQDLDAEKPLPNVWIGVSVEDQRRADERIPLLLQTPAAVRWLSCEPLLGRLELDRYLKSVCAKCGELHPPDFFAPERNGHFVGSDDGAFDGPFLCGPLNRRIGWVVVGGESGPGARPMHPQWARDLRDQCQAAGVAYHFKQWGEWAPWQSGCNTDEAMDMVLNRGPNSAVGIRYFHPTEGLLEGTRHFTTAEEKNAWFSAKANMVRVGKHAAGRLLDGRTWDEYPEVAHA